MPFQPYRSERGPDFISLALQLRREQRQEESQNRRDEAALIRARSQAKNDDLSRQARRLEMAEKYGGNVPDIAGLIRAVGEGRAAVEGAVDEVEPFPQVDMQTAADPAMADEAFGAIAEQLTARGEFENQLQPFEQALQTQIARQARLLKAARPELTDAQALGIAQRDVSASAFSQQAGEGRELSKTLADESRAEQAQIRQEGRAEKAQKRSEGRAAQRDLPQRQARIDERIAGMTEKASVAYRASRNIKLSDTQQKAALAQLDAMVDPLVAEYVAAYNVTPGQARRTIMAPIEGSPVVRAQELQEAGADITAKDLAEAESKTGVLTLLSREMRRVSALRKQTEDPEERARLDEQFDALQSTRASIADDEGERTISSGDLVKASRGYLSARTGLRNTEELLRLVESGQIKTGPAGLISSLGLRVTELAKDILTDPEVPDEMKFVAQQMAESGSNQISVGVGLTGKQLNLSADQLFLAWEIVKAKRESARFTLLELQSTLKLVDFTNPLKPKAQMVEMLKKVVRTQVDAVGVNSVIMRMGNEDPNHTWQRFQDDTAQFRLGSPSASGGNSGGSGSVTSTPALTSAAGADQPTATPASDPIPGSDEYAADAARRIANGTYSVRGN